MMRHIPSYLERKKSKRRSEGYFNWDTIGQTQVWVGENGYLKVVVVPSLGGKIVSLSTVNGREWLYPANGHMENSGYDSIVEMGDARGWDELFPNLDACHVDKFPWQGVILPDHGEVRSLPWQVQEARAEELVLSVHGVRLPYTLTRSLRLVAEDTLRLEYLLENHSPFEMPYFWSAHPLWTVRPGDRIELPDSAQQFRVAHSTDSELLPETVCRWPNPETTEKYHLDKPGCSLKPYAHKIYFVNPIPEGWARIVTADGGESLELRYDTQYCPYLVLWLNDKGWNNHLNVSIQPASGMLNPIQSARKLWTSTNVPGLGKVSWWVEITVVHQSGST
ncbi:hypothetical protein FY534_04225 [Alicyclobacillus sp. TC]|uniref:hypothetical protein n=1 Tax=Alicyclobacillus sp. TC TaxID=2606450 RepID=UPI001931C34B|nr:hypothetical protein [Alicyclobacillus sp. TC]QRF22972.1 hypothetical protein FY534_04225 [Alicyclobacillus sp. TC]